MQVFNSRRNLPITLKIFGFLGMLCASLSLLGQAEETIYKKALKSIENGNYVDGRDKLESIYSSIENSNEAASYLAECYLALHQEEKIPDLIKNLDQPDDYNLYDLALAYYFDEQFDSASEVASRLPGNSELGKKELIDQIRSAAAFYQDEAGIVIQNFGDKINSGQREYSGIMFNDFNSLLYTRRGEEKEITDYDGMAYESIYYTTIDSTRYWADPVPIKSDLENEKRHDAPVQMVEDGKTMISYHDGKLYKLRLVEDTWIGKDAMNLIKSSGIVTHCHITKDGKTIYFASDLKNPGGDLDLYQASLLSENRWSEPKPLTQLNTAYNEDAPFLAKDGTLYFSSRGHGSIGGYDVYKTTYDSAMQRWARPQNLGYPINSVDEDIYYSMEGKVGYISSSRRDGYGSLDMYRIFLFNKVKISGTVLDRVGKPVPDVRMDFSYDSSLIYAYTDIKGYYEIFLPINTRMHVTFVKDTLNLSEGDYIVNIAFRDKNNNEYNFSVTDTQDMPAENVNYEIAGKVSKIPIDVKNDFKPNPLVASISRKLENSWIDSLNVLSDSIRLVDQQVASRSLIEKSIQAQPNSTIYFRTNSAQLEQAYLSELDRVATSISSAEYPIVYINGYADIRGSKSLNYKLSFRRARAVYDWLVSKGVQKSKLKIQAFGELGGSEELSKYRKVEIKLQQ